MVRGRKGEVREKNCCGSGLNLCLSHLEEREVLSIRLLPTWGGIPVGSPCWNCPPLSEYSEVCSVASAIPVVYFTDVLLLV